MNDTYIALIADRGYGAKAFVDELIAQGIEPVIPPKQNAKQPREYDAGGIGNGI